MSIDITGLTNLIRRLDLSATAKSFLAVATVFFVAMNLVNAYVFITEVLRYDVFEEEGAGFVIAQITVLAVFAFSPLLFIVWDWIMRKPWRHLAAILGSLMGGVGLAILGGALGSLGMMTLSEFEEGETALHLMAAAPLVVTLILLMGWMTTQNSRLRAVTGWLLLLIIAMLIAALVYPALFEDTDAGVSSETLIGLFYVAISVAALLWFFIRTVRHQLAFASDCPRGVMLGAIHTRSFWARLAFLAGVPSSLWHVRAIATPEFWAFLLARPLTYAGVLVTVGGLTAELVVYKVAAIGAAMIVAGHILFYLGKRLAARHIWNPENPRDSRRPILFLRSFEDDQLRFRRPWWNVVSQLIGLWSFRRNADEMFIDEIAQYGPVVALGMPGEKGVPFGASRYYANHEDWQQIVAETAEQAQAIILVAGNTEGVRWEYDLIAERGLLDKTLLLFAPGANDEETISTALSKLLREEPDVSPDSSRSTIALLASKDGPTILQAEKPLDAAYLASIRAHFQQARPAQLANGLL